MRVSVSVKVLISRRDGRKSVVERKRGRERVRAHECVCKRYCVSERVRE